MRTTIVISLAILAATSAQAPACDRADPVKIGAVRFVRDEGAALKSNKAPSKPGALGSYTVAVDFSPGGGYESSFVLIASMEMIIAPRELPSVEVPGKDLEAEVSWGVLATEENLKSVVLQDVWTCKTISIKTFEFSLDRLVEKHFSDSWDGWPWVFRVRVVVLDRDGKVVARGEGKLKNTWPAGPISKESRGTSLERTRER